MSYLMQCAARLLALAAIFAAVFCGATVAKRPQQSQPTPMQRFILKVAPELLDAAISPDGARVATVAYPPSPSVSGVPQGLKVLLQLWDVASERAIVSTVLQSWSGYPAHSPDTKLLVRFTADGKQLLAYDGVALQALRLPDLKAVAKVDLGFPAPGPERRFRATDLQISPDGLQAALALRKGWSSCEDGGSLRVYNLVSGALEHEWKWGEGMPWYVAWAPNGPRLALVLQPDPCGTAPFRVPKRARNLFILDADSGRILKEINTGSVAGPVAFAAPDVLLTTPVEANDERSLRHDTITIWDASTGHSLREIANPPEGIHYHMAVSGDGRVVLGYTGLERYDDLAHIDVTIYRTFRLWDVATGKVLVTSPEFEPWPTWQDYWPPLKQKHPMKWAADAATILHLALSADGRSVLVYWASTGAVPMTVYKVE